MVDFRRWILAFAVLALFAGLASAQVGGTGNPQFQCATNVSSVPVLRAEGLTEQTGDIFITCTGGNPTPPGTVIPTVNISVNFNVNVTSRLVSSAASGTGVSEALLLIDEPGSASSAVVPGFGPAAPQRACGSTGTFFGTGVPVAGSPATGCTEFASVVGGVTVATDTTGGTTPGANVFQGVVNPNGAIPSQVTFFGVPVLAPVTTGTSRVFRITNIRINASAGAPGQVIASISVSNPSALPITSNVPAVGFIQPGLIVPAPVGSLAGKQCTGTPKAGVTVLSFQEGFGTAFKTRVFAQTNTLDAGQGVPTNQNVPGTIYPSESNFVLLSTSPAFAGSATAMNAGLADFGTRLKAVFHNVPAGMTIFVSTANVLNSITPAPVPAPIGGSTGNITAVGYAQLVSGETTVDGTTFTPVAATTTSPTGGIPIVALVADITGTATAVWEVVNTSPSSLDTLSFAVFSSFAANAVPPGQNVTVNQSFAPTPPAIPLTTGVLASGSLVIPRFADLSKTPGPTLISVNACHTVLLFPFVTNQAGFDTGIAIANTSQDPFGTPAQSGTCALNWFGVAAPAVATATPVIGATSTIPANVSSYAFLTSTAAPGFQGYMIATCNFQYAHGFAFISDIGAQKLAEGYLALVIPDPTFTAGARNPDPVTTALPGSGENIAH